MWTCARVRTYMETESGSLNIKGPREKGCVKQRWEESLMGRIIAEECGIWKWVKVKRRNGPCNRRKKGWRQRSGSQITDCSSSCNVRERWREGEMMGDRSMVKEKEGTLFVLRLGEGQRFRLMPLPPTSSHKPQYPVSYFLTAGLVVCVVVVVAVVVFLGAIFFASYWVKFSCSFFRIIKFSFKEIILKSCNSSNNKHDISQIIINKIKQT